MKKAERINQVVQVLAAMLVLVFLYTAIQKASDPVLFRRSMEQSALIRPYSKVLVWLVPGLEFLAVGMLILPFLRYWGLCLSTLLMTGFTFYIAYMLLFDKKLPCSCGGVLHVLTWKQHLLFNVLLWCIGLAGMLLMKKYQRIIAIKQE